MMLADDGDHDGKAAAAAFKVVNPQTTKLSSPQPAGARRTPSARSHPAFGAGISCLLHRLVLGSVSRRDPGVAVVVCRDWNKLACTCTFALTSSGSRLRGSTCCFTRDPLRSSATTCCAFENLGIVRFEVRGQRLEQLTTNRP